MQFCTIPFYCNNCEFHYVRLIILLTCSSNSSGIIHKLTTWWYPILLFFLEDGVSISQGNFYINNLLEAEELQKATAHSFQGAAFSGLFLGVALVQVTYWRTTLNIQSGFIQDGLRLVEDSINNCIEV